MHKLNFLLCSNVSFFSLNSNVVLGISVRRLVVIWVGAYHVTATAIQMTVTKKPECAE